MQRVRLRPVASLVDFFVFKGADGVPEQSGEMGSSDLKMGSPSLSKKFAVSISQAGYFLDGLTFAAKSTDELFWEFRGAAENACTELL